MDDYEEQDGPVLAEQFAQEAEVVEPEPPAFAGLIEPEVVRETKRRWLVTVRHVGTSKVLFRERGDLNGGATRDRIIEKVLDRLALDGDQRQALDSELEQYLMDAAASEPAAPGEAGTVVGAVEYEAIVDDEDPARTGFYAVAEKYQRRLSNFVMKVEEERRISDVDEVGESLRLRGTIRLHGESHPFEISTEDYSDHLRRAIFDAAGSRAEFLGGIDEIRTAISRNSVPQVRRYLTSPGWTADFSRYLVPGGFVDAAGYHETAASDDVPAIDLSGHERSRCLGLRRLEPEELREVKEHILADLMQITDRNVTSAMLAGVVLAPLIRRAEISSWPILWFAGLTGTGKSMLTCLCMNFFGDFGAPGSGQFLSWKATGNSIQTAGYDFRDALFLVDDFKPNDCKPAECVRVLQCYADRTARSRLKSDATMNTTKPIRGLLVSSGEDFPESNASGRGRAVIIPVPKSEKDPARIKRCKKRLEKYRGWTAAFITAVIRDDLGARFQERVDDWEQKYLNLIRGRPNDARIASNHACVAAAFEIFADFMSDVWAEEEAKEAARVFGEEFIAGLVVNAAGDVAAETPAQTFLNILGDQISFGRVRIEGVGPPILSDEPREREKVVGRLLRSAGRSAADLDAVADDEVIRLSIPFAMATVQEQLHRQGKPPLQISERALLDQFVALGCLLDPRDHEPILKGHVGEKTSKARIGGSSVNAACIRAEALRGAWGVPRSSAPKAAVSDDRAQTLPFMPPAPAAGEEHRDDASGF